jgi:3-methyladenine DNA glycosylase AlkC
LDFRKTIIILDNLYTDKSRFVTRSVANHLNDIAKIDGDLVVEVLENWKKKININSGQTHRSAPTKENVGVNLCVHPANDLDYIISHSTRTLVKA